MKIKKNKIVSFGLVAVLMCAFVMLCGFQSQNIKRGSCFTVYLELIQKNHPELTTSQAILAYAQNHRKTSERVFTEYDPVYYRNTYPDLNAAFGDNWAAYYDHFKDIGQYEGRLGNGDGYLTSCQKKQATTTAKQQAAAQAEANNPVVTDANQIAVAMFNNINARRAADGTAPMVWDDSYAAVAQQRAVALSQNFSHEGLPYGYGECAKHAPGAGMRLSNITFADSVEHDTLLRNPAYTKVGVGVYRLTGATYISVVFN